MLFIREYNTKSLDRSSVSMIDKYNTRLNKVDELLDRLASLVDNLLSLIRDIRNTLGQNKQRVYNNLDQVKEVVSGNGITGTESTIKAIEDALAAGDKAINEAEAQLENIQTAIDNNEEYCNDTNVGVMCGESPDEEADEECSYCSVEITQVTTTDIITGSCQVDIDCQNNRTCDEPVTVTSLLPDAIGCDVSYYIDNSSGHLSDIISTNNSCGEIISTGGVPTTAQDDCTFTCSHSSGCQEDPMPENCTYTCIDGDGCNYSDDDCSYSTTCGQAESCNESSCSQYDCGQECGETCHMTIECSLSDDCGEDSCGECSDELSDDDYYGCDDSDTDMCGEGCGDSCGL